MFRGFSRSLHYSSSQQEEKGNEHKGELHLHKRESCLHPSLFATLGEAMFPDRTCFGGTWHESDSNRLYTERNRAGKGGRPTTFNEKPSQWTQFQRRSILLFSWKNTTWKKVNRRELQILSIWRDDTLVLGVRFGAFRVKNISVHFSKTCLNSLKTSYQNHNKTSANCFGFSNVNFLLLWMVDGEKEWLQMMHLTIVCLTFGFGQTEMWHRVYWQIIIGHHIKSCVSNAPEVRSRARVIVGVPVMVSVPRKHQILVNHKCVSKSGQGYSAWKELNLKSSWHKNCATHPSHMPRSSQSSSQNDISDKMRGFLFFWIRRAAFHPR